ncbi:MAG: cupin domain-containing protein [Candidatus Zixiibacteriota bacterium]|nr:MAG: cupin domain-containing protein [candidate division Zixibacteria bacterium]
MLVRKLKNCPLIVAGDGTHLRELLHPGRDYPFSGSYSLAHAILPAGESSLKHILKSDEVYYIVSGRGEMHIDDEVRPVEAGDGVDIPPGSCQWLVNTGPSELEFLCIVDPAWRAEDEEIIE